MGRLVGRYKSAFRQSRYSIAVVGVVIGCCSLPAAAQNYVQTQRTYFGSNLITANFEDAPTAYADLSDRYAERAARYLSEIEAARRSCNRQSYEHNLRNLRALSYIAAGNLARARGARMRTAELANYNEAALERHRAAEVREAWAAHDLKELEKLITNMPGLPRRCFQAAGKQTDRVRVSTKGGREGNESLRGIEFEVARSVSLGVRYDPPGRQRGINLFLEGGVRFGNTTFAVDPGAFVPVNETIGFGQGFVGGGIEARADLGLLNRNIAYQLGSFPLGGSSGGFTFRLYDDGDRRNFDAPPVTGDVRHAANWSVTGYIGFPQVIQQPTGLPFQALIITPTVGITYQEDTLKSLQTLGGTTNVFENTFGRFGATVGFNFEIPAGNFTYGLTTGLTMLPSTTVHGTSSLGLPAHAKIDSQANFFAGARIGVRLFETDAIILY